MAGKEDLKLLSLLVSPFAVRVRMALSMKGVSYEYIEEDMFNKSELLLKMNPVHRMLCPAWIGILKCKTEDERAEKIKETFAAIGQIEEAFAKFFERKAFFGGDSIGYLDIVLGSCLFWFEAVRRLFGVEIINSTKAPFLAAWAERFGESTEAKEVVPEADEAVQYANKLAAAAAK
ncbi:hypothetical protein HU200_018485 [Digitaria exilis]|uniref:Glutathione S-transferase n=1 Tax=Digitaria exilis TaxID=1010633 RepID=A0A835KDZ1_9POAL|nr:hypothetical protein HU200_018485 [Digitaria exilis]